MSGGTAAAPTRNNKRPGAEHLLTRYLIRAGITLALLIIFLLHIYGLRIGLLTRLEYLAYDARVRLTMPDTVDSRVVVVDIDEPSIQRIGQWPWSRDKLGRMVDQLFERYGVRVVGFDMVFPEADAQARLALDLLDRIAETLPAAPPGPASAAGPAGAAPPPFEALRRQFNFDERFAASLENRATVLGLVFKRAGQGTADELGVLPPPVLGPEADTAGLRFIQAGGYTGNLPVLQRAAAAGGFFDNPVLSEDGVFRRVPLLQAYEGAVYQSLALALFRAIHGWPAVKFRFYSDDPARWDNLDLEYVEVGPARIPVDEDVAVYVPYRGRMYSFPYVSAADVIEGTASAELLRGAIVLVGTTAPGLFDLRVTPVGEAYAGVEVHANVLSGLLDDRIKHHPEYVRGMHFTMLLLVALLLTWVFARASILFSSLVAALTLAALTGFNLAMWEYGNFIVPLASPLAFTLLLFGAHMVYGYFIESRGKRQLSGLFGQYIPPSLVEEMARDPGSYSLQGESREMTVLFADVRDFTSVSESLSPTELTRLMNEYLTAMTGVIHEQRGTIDKYIGDAVMAFWGAPLADPDHAQHAVQAALGMTRTAARLRQDFKARGWPELHIGVGLNTGTMNVGNMGSEFRMAYTVMGDAVNLGSRLEGLTKQYGVAVIASETTREQAPDIQFLELDRVRVKGKEKPVAIFEPLGPRTAIGAEHKALIARHKQALLLYRQQKWDAAEREFFALQQAQPGRRLYALYLARIQHYRQQPPGPDWDGVTVYTTK